MSAACCCPMPPIIAGCAAATAAYCYFSSAASSPDCPPLVQDAAALFKKVYGKKSSDKIVAASAPGRVNLIGEHTDYNDGFVFPMAIDRLTVVLGRANGSNVYRIVSSANPNTVSEFTFKKLMALPVGRPTWDCYFRGVVVQYVKRGISIPPFDAVVVGNVPLGGGLSSSASLEVATATFLDQLLGISTSARDKALMAQKAEHEYAKMPCGVMDQFISVFGKKGHAMMLDCRSLEPRLVKMADPNVVVLITNSHVKHELNTGEYAVRRKQCESAVKTLRKSKPGVKALRDANMKDLKAVKSQMDPAVYKRARHVITENNRCVLAASALESNDYATMGKLMNESHDSLKNDYEVSCDEIDILVDIARAQTGVYGSRITGGGFGGCTVTLVAKKHVAAVQAAIEQEYLKKVGKKCTCMVSVPSNGACAIGVQQCPIMSKL